MNNKFSVYGTVVTIAYFFLHIFLLTIYVLRIFELRAGLNRWHCKGKSPKSINNILLFVVISLFILCYLNKNSNK